MAAIYGYMSTSTLTSCFLDTLMMAHGTHAWLQFELACLKYFTFTQKLKGRLAKDPLAMSLQSFDETIAAGIFCPFISKKPIPTATNRPSL